MKTSTTHELTHYALIGAAAVPIAHLGGESFALIFCLFAAFIAGLARKPL